MFCPTGGRVGWDCYVLPTAGAYHLYGSKTTTCMEVRGMTTCMESATTCME